MPEATPHAEVLDLNSIHDPDVRRALRVLHQTLTTTLAQQQMQIDALIEMMLDKHVGSLGEFKRQLVRLQQNSSRGNRIHEMIASAQSPPAH